MIYLQIAEQNNHDMWNLVNGSHKSLINGFPIRGYTIPGCNTLRAADQTKENIPNGRIWYVFNGMGSQWNGMGRELLKLPVFARSIHSSAATLRDECGYDLMKALVNPEPAENDTPLYCFVTIAAIQIGIVDVLTSLGIKPDGLIGHSAGEMLCAYADECLTARETILCAYYRGSSLINSGEFGMVAVGGSWTEVSRMCPPGIHPACHNAVNSVTVSGPKQLLRAFVDALTIKKIFAKEVNSCGQAFHSPHIKEASIPFLANLKKFMKEPKGRSGKWVSSSIPKNHWDSELALRATPEYFVNNFTSPVLFYDAVKEIPPYTTVIEIGPSGLLRGIVNKSTHKSNTVVAMQSRDSHEGLVDFLSALGQLYMAGTEMDVTKLYEDATYPVPLGTPIISPFIEWDHNRPWDVPKYGQVLSLNQMLTLRL